MQVVCSLVICLAVFTEAKRNISCQMGENTVECGSENVYTLYFTLLV